MRVFMDCEGCARKVRRALRGFEGVDDVKADYKTQMVAVKGRGAAAEPTKVVERIYRKCGKKAELIITARPSPPPPLVVLPPPEKNKENSKNKDEEEPQVVVAVLNIRMHCEACAQEIKNKILRVKAGVHEADPNLVASQVTVKGVFNPATLAEYVHKRTRKHVTVAAVHVPLPSPPPLADAPSAEENRQNPNQETEEGGAGGKKEGGKKQKDKENNKTKKSGGVDAAAAVESMVVAVGPTAAAEAGVIGGGGGKVTSERYDANSYYYYYHPRYPAEYYAYPRRSSATRILMLVLLCL
uniref:HMA domain-containing protein n=1 Tax=Ananas comosus var. bracteatus TaxID=296719 RepID=A0A6V7QTB4_ANACO